jgi:hypothetical protein
MKRKVGVWIDHKKAVIVTMTTDGEEITHIMSDIGKAERISGSSTEIGDESPRSRRFTEQLNKYYGVVLRYMRDKVSILILGPGKAKIEFQKRLEAEALSGRIIGIESADKMTDRQIAARVRKQYMRQA